MTKAYTVATTAASVAVNTPTKIPPKMIRGMKMAPMALIVACKNSLAVGRTVSRG